MKRRNGDRSQLFLFVNKDQSSKSLSKSEGASAKEINRHAQQVRNRRLAHQKASTARHSSSSARRIALGGWNKRDDEFDFAFDSKSPGPGAINDAYASTPPGDHGSTDVTPAGSRDNSSASPSPPASTPERRESDDDGRRSSESAQSEPQQSPTADGEAAVTPASPRHTFSASDGVDPFGVLPVRINEKIHVALQHALNIYQYSGNNYKLAFLPQHMRPAMNQFPIKDVVHQSVYQERHLYSLLAAISIRMKHLFGHASGEDPQLYRAKAVYHLRNELIQTSRSGEVDKHTILDILFLCVSEMAHGEYESAHKHLAIVSKLYPVLDTREHFDLWISETAAHVDNQLALCTGNRPVLLHSFDPGALLPERMAALKRELRMLMDQELVNSYMFPSPTALAVTNPPRGLKDAVADLAASLDLRMGTQFEWGLKVGVYDAKMSRIIQDLVDCVAIAKVVWLSPHAVCFDAEWLCRKARAVLRALLLLAPENNVGPMDLLGKCMEGARISLMIMMSHACTMIGVQTAKANAARLQQAMSFALEFWCPVVGLNHECELLEGRTLDRFSEIQLGNIVWAMMVGIWSCELVKTPEVEEWFLIRAVNIFRLIGIRNYFDLCEHMVQYLLSKALQDSSIRKVASLLEQGQEG